VLQAALQAAWAEILVETASSFHGLDSPSKAALSIENKLHPNTCTQNLEYRTLTYHV
jgi:hypothetical protein